MDCGGGPQQQSKNLSKELIQPTGARIKIKHNVKTEPGRIDTRFKIFHSSKTPVIIPMMKMIEKNRQQENMKKVMKEKQS